MVLGSELTFAARFFGANERQEKEMKKLAQVELDRQLQLVASDMKAQWFGGKIREKNEHFVAHRFRSIQRILHEVFWRERGKGQPEPEIFGKWRSEREARLRYRRVASATFAVHILDQRLGLNSGQIAPLVEAVADVWQEEWDCYLQLMSAKNQHFPPIASNCLRPHLTKEQFRTMEDASYIHVTDRSWRKSFGMFDTKRQNPWFANSARNVRQPDLGHPLERPVLRVIP